MTRETTKHLDLGLKKPEHVSFVSHYSAHGNITNAYVSAYGTKHRATAARNGNKLLRRDDIREALRRLNVNLLDKLTERLKSIALGADASDFADYLSGAKTLEQLKDEGVDTRLIKGFKRTETMAGVNRSIDLLSPLDAVDKLMKILGVANRTEITGKDGGPIEYADRETRLRRLLGEAEGRSTGDDPSAAAGSKG